jgi:hypothetical protein
LLTLSIAKSHKNPKLAAKTKGHMKFNPGTPVKVMAYRKNKQGRPEQYYIKGKVFKDHIPDNKVDVKYNDETTGQPLVMSVQKSQVLLNRKRED